MRRALSACAVLLVCCLAACSRGANADGGGNSRQQQRQQARNQAQPVGVVAAQQKDVPIFLTGLGTAIASNTVTVRSRVDGAIVKVNFREGQHVNKGDLLAEIDPRPFDVQLQQADANYQRDQALLNTSRVNLQRSEALAKAGVVAQQALDQQRAETGQYQGSIQGDVAAINSAKLNLAYSKIAAPISGRVGLRQIDVGNIVQANATNGICVITQLQPIAVVFTLPSDNIDQVRSRMAKSTLPVEAWSRDDTQQIASGKLETIDNQIDPTTGTVRLKAMFDNKDEQLWPNEFVNVHLRLQTQKNALVIPASAIQRGPQGTFVYVVGQDNKVQVRPVTVQLTQGLTTLIAQGLQPNDRVVTDGQERLQEGALVDPRAPQRQQQSGGNQNASATGGADQSAAPGTEAAVPAAPPAPGNQQMRGQGNGQARGGYRNQDQGSGKRGANPRGNNQGSSGPPGA